MRQDGASLEAEPHPSPGASAEPLAIVAGAGGFPRAVADAVARTGRPVLVLALAGVADADLARYPRRVVKLGQFGRFLQILRQHGCREVVFVGGVTRPAGWRDLVPDLGLLRRLPEVAGLFRGGDDRLLSGVARITERAGIRVRGVHEVAPSLVLPAGALGRRSPDASAHADIRLGLAVLGALGPYDVGQAVVAADGRVLAVEAAEGTDAMLLRIAELRRSGRLKLGASAGVLVKSPKPDQDLRVDLPAVGPATLAALRQAELRGIGYRAGGVIALDASALVAEADRAGLFLYGAECSPPSA